MKASVVANFLAMSPASGAPEASRAKRMLGRKQRSRRARKSEQTIALVTGASRGIGAAIAMGFARRGVDLVLTCREQHMELATIAKRCRKYVKVHTLDLDMNDAKSRQSAVSAISDAVGDLTFIVNNVGMLRSPAHWTVERIEDATEVIVGNLLGPLELTRRLLPLLTDSGHGAVVNIGSVYGRICDPNVLSYCIAKAGVDAATRALARDLAPKIRVNAVLPGHIWTDMTKRAPQAFLESVVKKTPLGRIGEPSEVAALVVFLAMDAHFITGQCIASDGGFGLLAY